ncbi:soluble calcium-activated nucleotidase 1 [Chelonus insularis]|uniref:soluble calcium-activated nucleotidase 1 n=1 Tax=Chelonus insularis TaxID=460826 RepID=UPI00158DAD4F|nr:soluble calcium-activated nucleotidase 1 [Chelonus insularis]XP_034952170.1 soluble calcium-activated nucleotidase 1 [Chelonus insularis]
MTNMFTGRNWRNNLDLPHVYRVGSSTLRIQNHYLIIFFSILLLILLYFCSFALNYNCFTECKNTSCLNIYKYNSTYPMTAPIRTNSGTTYRIGIVSDLDLQSKANEENKWISYFKKGWLTWLPKNNHISVHWDEDEISLSSTFSMKDRGMELSELVTFDGRLLSFDDRTGLVYQIENDKIYPWIILADGDGKTSKGFKSEWAAVKNNLLYIGSMGKEWTSASGEFVNNNPMWIKVLSPDGASNSLNWMDNYKKLRASININFPGYMIHESGTWSNIHKSWFFLPRRCSQNQYNETTDENMSCNVLLKTDEYFSTVAVIKIGTIIPIRGYSSFKFLPGSNDYIIVALKTEEYKGDTATYITAFTIDGSILLPDTKIATQKFEGLEFI